MRRIHLSTCDYCGRKIAWSRRRRQWLSLAPITSMPGKQLARRMRCPDSPTRGAYHDPKFSVFDRAFSLLAGAR